MFIQEPSAPRPLTQTDVFDWLMHSPPLTVGQKLAIGFSFVSCLLSTAVCAPMGGSGSQSLFETKSPSAYWPFFFLSPILILFLCGRATYYAAKSFAAPRSFIWKKMRKTPPPKSQLRLRFALMVVLGAWSGAINAYNATEYLPAWLAVICFPFALFVPGVVNIPAIKEYHQRVFEIIKFLYYRYRGLTYQRLDNNLSQQLAISKRAYYRLPTQYHDKINADFLHPYITNADKFKMLLNPFSFLNDVNNTSQDNHSVTYVFAFLGLVVGSLSQLYAYPLGYKIGGILSGSNPIFSVFFGVVCAYLGIGINGVACSDVFSELSDAAHHMYQTRSLNNTAPYYLAQLTLFCLAFASSLSNVENQIKVMGNEGFFAKLLTSCAIISPICLGFWAGGRVLDDLRYRRNSPSFIDSHDRLTKALPQMNNEARALLNPAAAPVV